MNQTPHQPDEPQTDAAPATARPFPIPVAVAFVVPVWAAFVVFSVLATERGLCGEELRERMPVHLSGLPIRQILFHKAMDSVARPRQLSHLFDVLDAHVVSWCIQRGHPHFLSATHFLFALAIGLLLFMFMEQQVQLSRWTATGLVVLLYLTPAFCLYGNYFRTAKIGVSLSCAALVWGLTLAWRAAHGAARGRSIAAMAATLGGAVMACALFDEQGIAGGVVGLVVAGALLLVRPNRAMLAAVGAIAASLVGAGSYYWAFPRIFRAFNGQQIHYDFHTEMLSLPFDLLSTVCGAFSLLLDSARFLLGNVSPSLALTAGGLFIALSIADVGSQRTAGGAAAPGIGGRGYALIVVLVLFAMWFMLAGMLVRHPPIAWDDLRRVYYCLPTTTVLAFLVPGLVAPHFHRWTAGFGQRRVSLGVSVILLLILGSLVALPQHKNVIWHGFAKRHHDHTPVLLEALTQLHDPTYVPAHQVTTDPLYRLIRETAARKK